MSNNHVLTMSPKKYPGDLRIVECTACRYAFAVKVNEKGMMRMDTIEHFNEGDQTASHALFQMPQEMPTVQMSSQVQSR